MSAQSIYTFAQFRKQVERVADLQSKASPENFWCDGEKSRTPQAYDQWDTLQKKQRAAEEYVQLVFSSRLTKEGQASYLALLPENLKFTAQLCGLKAD